MRLGTFVTASLLVAAAFGSAEPLPLKVAGTKIVNSKGKRVILRGVNAASLEWTSDGQGRILKTVDVAINDWKCNLIRLPMSQDRWFGAGPEQTDKGVAYRSLVKQVVDKCSNANVYIMLDLHWNNAGQWGQNIGQHVMPDRNSITFWRDVARTYKNNPAVLFDLYNEPHDISWDVWLKGGKVTEKNARTRTESSYESAGHQELLDAVRRQGAKNVVVVGGLDWSYDMSGFMKGFRLWDPAGNGVIYANHAYPFKGDTFEQWQAKITAAAKVLPIVVSEFGAQGRGSQGLSAEQWVSKVLKTLRDLNLSWAAWDLHPEAGPTLISDWNYTPTPTFGVLVKEALAKK